MGKGENMPFQWIILMRANGGMDNYKHAFQKGVMTKEKGKYESLKKKGNELG